MPIDSFALFVCASVVLCIVPGPDMVFLLGRTIAQGRKAGMIAAVGINAGGYVHLTAAVLGLSAILAASATAFTIIKWIGAAYLVHLGVKVLMNRDTSVVVDGSKAGKYNGLSIFWQGFLSDVLNPKVALFFLAFLPQFIDPAEGHHTRQILFLGCTVNIIAILINLTLVYFASLLTEGLRNNRKISFWLNKVMGLVFISLGLRLAYQKL